MIPIEVIFLGILGLIIGSFINVVIYRLPQGKSLFFPFSHCPKCQKLLKWYHNIPILSYLFLKGKCAYCGEKISIQYPLVEALSALLIISLYLRFKPHFDLITFIFLAYFVLTLLTISFIDLKHKEIPDLLSLPLIFAGWFLSLLGKNPLHLSFVDSLISALAGMGLLFFIDTLYYHIAKRESIGMGDFKLMGGFGAYLGYQSFFNILFLASLLGVLSFLLFKVYLKLRGDKRAEEKPNWQEGLRAEIPFGPFLCLSALIYLFNPQSLL